MKKKIFRFATFLMVVFLLLALLVPDLFGATGDVAEEGQSWLAKQLEIYGVPAGISATLGTAVGFLLYYLATKGLRKVKNEFISATDKTKITSNTLSKLIDEVKQEKLEIQNTYKEFEKITNELIVPLLKETREQLAEVRLTKNELNKGASKIIKSLTEGIDDNNRIETKEV